MAESAGTSCLRRVDARFLLPLFPETAIVMHPEWVEGLEQAGIRIVEPDKGPADLVVAPARLRDAALRAGAPMTVLDGRPHRGSGVRATAGVRRYLPVQTRSGTVVIADLSRRHAAERALAMGTHAGNAGTAAKRSLARAVVRLRLLPPIVPMYTIHALSSTTPAFVQQAAQEIGVEVAAWFLLIEGGADNGRLAFFLFTGRGEPQMVVKFSRLSDDQSKARREVRGLEAARAAGPAVLGHAPRLISELEISRYHATVETAAAGQGLGRTVSSRRPREQKLKQINAVVDWLCEIARTTVHPRGSLADDVRSTVRRNFRGGDADRLLQAVCGAPAVFQHGDLGERNTIVDGDTFVVIDWEHARADGFPLWDLLCLAVATLPLLDRKLYDSGEHRDDKYVQYLGDLFRGRATSSADFLRWLRSVAIASKVDLAIVPEIVTLWVLCYSEQQWAGWAPFDRFATEWLEDPELGMAWSLWRQSLRGS